MVSKQYNRRTHGYDEQRLAEAYAHMNNGQFEIPVTLDDPRVAQIRVYNKLLEQQTNSANPIPQVKSWVRSELALRQDLPESRSVQQVEDDDAFCQSYLSVYG